MNKIKKILLFTLLVISLVIVIFIVLKKDNKESTILIENDTIILPIDITYVIKAISYPKHEEISWHSTNEDILELKDDGTITTLKVGEANITLKNKFDEKNIKVIVTDNKEYANYFNIVNDKIELEIGEKYLIQTNYSPQNTIIRELSYESLNTDVATVIDGYITAISTGRAQINVSMKIDDNIVSDNVMVVVGNPDNSTQIEELSFNLDSLELALNENYQLEVNVLPKDAVREFDYFVLDENVVSVDNNGIITAKGKGTTTIEAFTKNGHSAKIEVKVVSSENGISLNKEEISIAKGEIYTLKSNFVNGIEWYSSNNKVATVSNDGIVKGLTDGKAVITVINNYGKMNTVNVTVKGNGVLVDDILIDVEEITIKTGSTYQLNAIIKPSNATNKEVTWETNDSRILNIDDDGLIFGKMEGTTTVIGYSSNNKQVTVKVNVVGSGVTIDSLDINPSTMTLAKGDTYKLIANLIPSNVKNQNIIWSSSNPSIINVINDGTITALKNGSAVISATSNGLTSKANIYVSDNIIEISSLNIEKESIDLELGKTFKLNVKYLPNNATNSKFKYTSSNTSVATVSNNGLITTLGQGTSVITVTSTNGISDKVTVNVSKNNDTSVLPTEILLNYDSLNLQKGETKQLKATMMPLNANQDITWVSGNEDVIRINSSGLVTANNPGSTVISAITKNGLVAKITAKVQYPPIASTNTIMTMNSDSIKVSLEQWSDFHVTRIWLSDPGKQIHKIGGIGLKTVSNRMYEVYGSKNLANKIVVASNGSAFHSAKYDSDPKYNGSALGKLIITEGKVLRNDINYNENTNGNKYYYYTIDQEGTLKVESSTANEKHHNEIINYATNTFAFYPFFKNQGVLQPTWGNVGARRHALCQIDANNYAIITTAMDGTLPGVARVVDFLGCHTAVNLDGGGSTTLIFKNRGQSFPANVFVGNQRAVPDVLYFSEL